MIIHHQDKSKLVISAAQKAEMSIDGRMFLAYHSIASNYKGIVELTADEVAKILAAASKGHRKGAKRILGAL